MDVDSVVKEGNTHSGSETWNPIVIEHGEPDTYKVTTPSGGEHYYITEELPNAANALGEGIDGRGIGKGYVVAAGSHVTKNEKERVAVTGFYMAVNHKPISSVPWITTLKGYTSASPERGDEVENPEPVITNELLAECLAALDPVQFRDQDKWFKLMCSCHHATAGQGYPEWSDWSLSDAGYNGNTDNIENRWNSLHVHEGGDIQIDSAGGLIERLKEVGALGLVWKIDGDDGTDAANDNEPDPEPEEEIPASPKSHLEVIDLENVESQNIDYVWQNRIALGKHSAIAGVGGLGKSQVLYNTAARISKGEAWPEGEGKAPKGSVLILSAEDDIKDMMKPRLEAAGADIKLVKPIKAVVEGSGNKKKFNLLADLDALYRLCRERGDVVMVGIDPLGSYLGGTLDTHRDAALRSALDPISEMASAANVAFLSIMHFNKAGSMKSAMDRVMGGAGFVNAPRCAMGWLVDPNDETKRLLLRLKTNMGDPQGLRGHVATADVGKDKRTGLSILAPHIVWDGAADVTADAVVAMANERETPKLDEAKAFLEGELKDGPRPVEPVQKAARAMSITADTLKRARYELGIKARQIKGAAHAGWEYYYADTGSDFGEE